MQIDWSSIFSWTNVFNLIDILIVWLFIFQLLKILKNTKAFNILNGVFIFLLIKIISTLFQLKTVDWIMNNIIQWSVIGVIVIFQPEIRRGLDHLGQQFFAGKREAGARNPNEKMVRDLVEASEYMSKRRIGALISMQRSQPLNEYASTGITLNSAISSQLLINIFIPNTPLHDGAVIIQDMTITSAASYLPLSENPDIPKELGTRHRAAVGLSEVTDALTIVVSEETGGISVVERGEITRDLSKDALYNILADNFIHSSDEDNSDNFLSNWFNQLTGGGKSDD
ncbi:TIGR00159 family protein [Aerococcus agrisoli]|uniref:Diadenylate cyclase n=1 Tax=Aerococcus agrisoli TaxID=2487350 RepID=A0A3N4GE03_9LACT|nr:diadenylate cyclase CdaA [Aerococcus agrisoli]RPA60465.1 TIGR00159 family protein [Aerococcus agrisoli]